MGYSLQGARPSQRLMHIVTLVNCVTENLKKKKKQHNSEQYDFQTHQAPVHPICLVFCNCFRENSQAKKPVCETLSKCVSHQWPSPCRGFNHPLDSPWPPASLEEKQRLQVTEGGPRDSGWGWADDQASVQPPARAFMHHHTHSLVSTDEEAGTQRWR